MEYTSLVEKSMKEQKYYHKKSSHKLHKFDRSRFSYGRGAWRRVHSEMSKVSSIYIRFFFSQVNR